ncbi:lysozyme inhibitor LprI family protein [Methylobacterium oryzae CBMB20]|uniref:Lysozyme inhibitor LprI-like N-terminal domain-containing protein n=2 Tax=Methylobacterium oryzae TaxID=334852 RepID=A0ABU7TKM0_9HYPH
MNHKRSRLPQAAASVLAGLLACLVGSTTASADQPSAKLCLNETSTPGTTDCMNRALQEADAKLNAAYKKAMSVIDHDDRAADPNAKALWKTQLERAQRAWIAFRDADCGDLTYSEWANGSGANPAVPACRYDKTVDRTADLLGRYPLH